MEIFVLSMNVILGFVGSINMGQEVIKAMGECLSSINSTALVFYVKSWS